MTSYNWYDVTKVVLVLVFGFCVSLVLEGLLVSLLVSNYEVFVACRGKPFESFISRPIGLVD